MMYTVLFIILLLLLLAITYQDIKERMVYAISFICAGILLSYFHLQNSTFEQFSLSVGINFIAITIVIVVLLLYTKLILKKSLNESIGLGDLLFFMALVFGFPTVSFLWLFSCSLIFSGILFVLTKKNLKHKTVPLAGYQSIFLLVVLVLNEYTSLLNLYLGSW